MDVNSLVLGFRPDEKKEESFLAGMEQPDTHPMNENWLAEESKSTTAVDTTVVLYF